MKVEKYKTQLYGSIFEFVFDSGFELKREKKEFRP